MGSVHQQAVIAAGLAADVDEVALSGGQVGAEHEGATAGQFAQLQAGEACVGRFTAQAHRALIEIQAVQIRVAGEGPQRRAVDVQRAGVADGAGQAGVVRQGQVDRGVFAGHDVASQAAVAHREVDLGIVLDFQNEAVAAHQARSIGDMNVDLRVHKRRGVNPDGAALAPLDGGVVDQQVSVVIPRASRAAEGHDTVVVADYPAVLTNPDTGASYDHTDTTRLPIDARRTRHAMNLGVGQVHQCAVGGVDAPGDPGDETVGDEGAGCFLETGQTNAESLFIRPGRVERGYDPAAIDDRVTVVERDAVLALGADLCVVDVHLGAVGQYVLGGRSGPDIERCAGFEVVVVERR